MKYKNSFRGYYIAFCCAMVVFSCNPNKEKWLNRKWHSLVGHYNIYFNGEEKLNEAIENLKKGHVDNFNEVLQVFPYGTEAAAKGVNNLLEDAMKKFSGTIQLHKVGSYTDNAWFAIAKTHFFKRDYYASQEAMQYMISKYPNEYKNKSTAWIAKAYVGLGKIQEAEAVIGLAVSSKKIEKKDIADVYLTAADINIKLEKYKSATENLTKVLKECKLQKEDKIRYHFILGQLYMIANDKTNAISHFNKVVNLIASYEFSFNANINITKLYDVNDKKAVNKVRKSLKRMAKDDKNTEYLAQIYYELGKLELSQSNFAAAIFAFKKSNENAQTNVTQKAKSCLELAQLFFETKEYKLAKAYYDTTVSIYDKKSSKYGAIMATKVALNELINNINVYEREDSLQALSKLSKTELDKKVSNWIESDKKRKMLEAKEAKRKKQIESSLEANKFENGAPNVPVAFDNSAGGANWYFYNTNLINSGIVDFFSGRKWGNRINEDFWRLSNKEKANLVGSTDAGTDSSEQENKNKPIKTDDKIEAAQIDNKPVENKTVSVFGDSLKDLWVKDVPFTEEALETSNLSMMEALHNLGILYYSKIKNFKEAITYFNLLESKFPASEYEPEAWYYLYKSHSEIKENDNASKYKSDLIAKYPTDKFTLLLEGKSSKTSSTDQNKELVILYDHTFDAYKNGNYLEVKSLKEEADKKFPGNTFRPKFELLYALALAKTDSLSVFKQALNNIIKEFPKTDVSDQATSILAVLDKSEIKQKIVGTDTNMVTFDMEPESAHYYIMAIKSNKANFTEYTDKIFTYNEAYAMNDNLKVNVLMSNDGFQYLLVREFPNLKKAESYYKGVLANKVIESKLKVTEPYFDFVISTSNYKKIMRDKQIEAYSKYFKKILLTQSQ